MKAIRLSMEFRGGSGQLDYMANTGLACSTRTVYRVAVVGTTLTFTAVETDTVLWRVCCATALAGGAIAAVDYAQKVVYRFSPTRRGPMLVGSTVAGAAFNHLVRDGPRHTATFHMPTCIAHSIDGELFVGDANTVRRISRRDVVTVSKVPGQITALSPSGLGRHAVVAGTTQGHICTISPTAQQAVIILPGRVDALLVTAKHVAIAAVAFRETESCLIFAVNLLAGTARILHEMPMRVGRRPTLLAWCGDRVVAVGSNALLMPWSALGRPVRHSHFADWRCRAAWPAGALAAARTFALVVTRNRMRRRSGLWLPAELVAMMLRTFSNVWL